MGSTQDIRGLFIQKVSHVCVEGLTIRPTLGRMCGKEGTLRIWSCRVINLVTNLKITLESVLARMYILCCPYRRTLYSLSMLIILTYLNVLKFSVPPMTRLRTFQLTKDLPKHVGDCHQFVPLLKQN